MPLTGCSGWFCALPARAARPRTRVVTTMGLVAGIAAVLAVLAVLTLL